MPASPAHPAVHSPTEQTRARVSRPVPSSVDVAIIGAGPGGLMAAARIAASGRSVAVLDSHYVAGGCATMFSRGSGDQRFCFDIGLHYVGGGRGSRMDRSLREVGVEIDWRPLDPDGFDELIFPGLRFRVPASVELYRDRLVAVFPKEKAGIDRYVRLLREVRHLTRPDAPKGWRLAIDAAFSARLAASNREVTLGAFLDTCTQDRLLRAVIAGQNGDYGLPPSRVSLMLHAGLANHYFEGAFYPRGGGQVIADRLAERIEAAGGSIHLRHTATAVLVEQGRAVGVRWTGPQGNPGELRARVVLSNADIRRTFLDLLPADSVPAADRERAQGWKMGGAIFLTCLAVRADLAKLGMGATNYWAFDHDDFDALYAELEQHRPPAPPPVRGCYITSATLKDPGTPGHAPEGVHTVEIMALSPGDPAAWGVPADQALRPTYRQGAAYLDLKRKVEDDLVGRLERLFPGSTAEILHRESATPVTHTRFTRASAGSGYGLAATPDQFLQHRPGYRGPLPGLYLCGGSTRSGHGISGALASGVHAARTILKDA